MISEVTKIRLYAALRRVRPAQLGALFKLALGIQRQRVSTYSEHNFWVDPVSVMGFALLKNGIYEPSLSRLLETLLRSGDVFIDVGANEGYFSVLASSRVHPTGHVYAIEPQSRLQPVLRRNLEENNADVVTQHQVALTDGRAEREQLYLRPTTNTGASSMFRHWRLGTLSESVPATTVDAFFLNNRIDHARLMKVDCEGAEHLVVKGAKHVLEQQQIDFITLEFHEGICGVEACQRTHTRMIDAGYILRQMNGLGVYHLPGFATELKRC